jgi:Ca2+/H+ antiporter
MGLVLCPYGIAPIIAASNCKEEAVNHPVAPIAGLMLIGSLIFSIVTFVSMLKQHHEMPQDAEDAHNQHLDFLQSLVMIYGALLPVYLPELYADLRLHQHKPADKEDS